MKSRASTNGRPCSSLVRRPPVRPRPPTTRRSAPAAARRGPRPVRPPGLPQHHHPGDRRGRRRQRIPAVPALRLEGRSVPGSPRPAVHELRRRASARHGRPSYPKRPTKSELSRQFVGQLYDVLVENRGLLLTLVASDGAQRRRDRGGRYRRHQASARGARRRSAPKACGCAECDRTSRTYPRTRRWR